MFFHLGGDIFALILCHIFFLGKYRLPYKDIFAPLLPDFLKPYCVVLGIATLILIWLFAFYISGHYSNTARKSGLQIIGPNAATAFTISILLFFILANYSSAKIEKMSLELSIRYFLVVFSLTFFFRMIIITRLHQLIKKGRLGYKQVLIGNNQKARDVILNFRNNELLKQHYLGYLCDNDDPKGYNLSQNLPCLGNISEIDKLVAPKDVDEAIVCLDHANTSKINSVINSLRQKGIIIRLATDINALIEGTVRTQNIESLPYITIGLNKMPVWQLFVKRTFDIIMGWLGLIISSPICIVLAIAIKQNSKGPIFYKQERIGKHQKPFMIYKFRSMYTDAEKDGPALASSNDNRITPIGKYMRKWRLDELPQFINVIMGDMSFVGPRPERQFFIDKILPIAPHYSHLFTVRPGITSWGMVKFGYAQTIDEMIERLQYDILYLENRTLVVDFKIMLYTLRTVVKGEGK